MVYFVVYCFGYQTRNRFGSGETDFEMPFLKPLHTIGKVSLNDSILYKNQEICNKTNLWKFQLISLFLLRENGKNAFSIFVFILMARVFVSRDENSLLDLISLIIRKR